MHSERNGPSSDAIDAESEVKNRAEHGQKPDKSEPECCGTGIALVKQGMNRGEQRGQKIKACSQMRPELGNFVEPVHRLNTFTRIACPTRGFWRVATLSGIEPELPP